MCREGSHARAYLGLPKMRIALALLFAVPAVVRAQEPAPANSASSSHFVVRSYAGGPSVTSLLARCEAYREELQTAWLGNAAPWKSRCNVVVHASRAAYLEAVGRGGGQTYGSSLIRFNQGQVAVRRIDLLPNADGEATALRHELTHVVLADRFGGRQPPRWVDEGVATLADSQEKRRLHQRDCLTALDSGKAIPLVELLRLERCTSSDQAAAFYGQSLSLVSYLIEQDSPDRLLAMVELGMQKGFDDALRATYGIESLGVLERDWRAFAVAAATPADAMQFTALDRPSNSK